MEWQDGKYILIDGILSEVIHRKGNVIKALTLGSNKESYIVSDENGNYAHGETLKDAYNDLRFKTANRSKDDYKELTVDSELSLTDAVICYRVITGACRFGVKEFCKAHNLIEKPYTISEIIELTRGSYGGDTFNNFFKK